MNTHQIETVQSTFALAAPQADAIAERFYQRLFELDPSLRPLFHGDMAEQGSKMMVMVCFMVIVCCIASLPLAVYAQETPPGTGKTLAAEVIARQDESDDDADSLANENDADQEELDQQATKPKPEWKYVPVRRTAD